MSVISISSTSGLAHGAVAAWIKRIVAKLNRALDSRESYHRALADMNARENRE